MNKKIIFYKRKNIYLINIFLIIYFFLLLVSNFYILNIKQQVSLLMDKQYDNNLQNNKDNLLNDQNDVLEKSLDFKEKKYLMSFLNLKLNY